MKFTLIFVLAAALLLACGEGADEEGVDASSSGERRTIAIVDSIGVEMGDSNYVLGAVARLCFGPDDDLYAFDLVRGSVMVYSPMGEYRCRISRRGEGPGEIVFPLDMTVLNDGRIMITALGGIHEYLPSGEYVGVAGEYFQNPPMNLNPVGDSSLIASKLSVEPNDQGEIVVNYWLARLDDECQPDMVYATDTMPFDPENLTELLMRTWLAYSMAGDRDGRVYLAPYSSEDFIIDIYDWNGDLIRSIEMDFPRVEKSELEILEEKEWMELHLRNMGVNGVVIEHTPDPYRRMITDLGIDGEGRIWARRGTELNPVFEVFSLEGEHLFTAEIPDVGDRGQFWNFTIEENGMAAYSSNPELYQQLFILELQD